MTEISIPLDTISKRANPAREGWDNNQSWWNFTAFLCLAGGISFGIIGLFLSGIGYFAGADGIDCKIGTTLVFSAFPLTILGAHCFNKIEQVKKPRESNTVADTDY